MKFLSIFDPESRTPRLREDLATLDPALADRVTSYLEAGSIILRTTQLVPDAARPEDHTPVVPISTRSDGTYVWSEAVPYYVRTYHVSPGHDFLAHLESQGWEAAALSADEVASVSEALRRRS